jgi:hypothetical protein
MRVSIRATRKYAPGSDGNSGAWQGALAPRQPVFGENSPAHGGQLRYDGRASAGPLLGKSPQSGLQVIDL